MGRNFEIPDFFRSPVIGKIKAGRKASDPRKKDISPSILDLGRVRFKIARHFGFCFGVENAIEITYGALKENPGRRVFLLSEMIHNPHVNADLKARGVEFLQETDGTVRIPIADLRPTDIVIVPAFGTTFEMLKQLEEIGLEKRIYNATCPFVEKVWNRSHELGQKGYTIIIHGKHYHEETRATFSQARLQAPALIIRDMKEAQTLAHYIRGEGSPEEFARDFLGKYSSDLDPEKHLQRIGVVNQTTMLASDTRAISKYLRDVMESFYGRENLRYHFADTRDTLCYATSENQDAVKALMESRGDFALVIGGYNSSNTSHLHKLMQSRLPAYYIKDALEILSLTEIRCLEAGQVVIREGWFPDRHPLEILITAGASSPDALVDQVIRRIADLCGLSLDLPLAEPENRSSIREQASQ
ncbi:MAG: 4-hydroxy-3-methylbut-2-enyl diphosphate reductase [Spirochaetales bacterium]|nr:4-hydroxy-3-methylbut-2-enyl diphosphate reductase [Spirochaetales bacterium]